MFWQIPLVEGMGGVPNGSAVKRKHRVGKASAAKVVDAFPRYSSMKDLFELKSIAHVLFASCQKLLAQDQFQARRCRLVSTTTRS